MQFLVRRFAGVAMRIYLVSAIIDAVFVFCVLSEISMSVLKPVRASLPRWTLFAVAGLIAFVCAAVWPFARPSDFHQGPTFQLVLHMQLTTALVRVLFFSHSQRSANCFRSAGEIANSRLQPDSEYTHLPAFSRHCCPAVYRAAGRRSTIWMS